MPFVRSQPGKKPGDQQREQVEQQSGLQRESGLVGSTGGSLHEGRARPQAPTPAAPTQQAQKPVSRAVNLSDYAAANVDKTRALAQKTAAGVATGARRAQSRLGQAQQEFGGLVNQGPSVQEGLQQTRDIQAKAGEGPISQSDVGRYRRLTEGYKGPQSLGEVDTNLAAKLGETAQAGQLATTTEGQRGLLQQQVGDQAGYTAGAGALDASLIAGQAGGIQQAGRAATAVGQRGLEAQTASGQQAQARAANLEELATRARQGLSAQVGDIGYDAQQTAEQNKVEQATDARQFQDFLQSGDSLNKSLQSLNTLGEELNTINVERATKGVSPNMQQQIMSGQIEQGKYSWQDWKSHFDDNGWNDADGEAMATEILKLIENRSKFAQAEYTLQEQQRGFTSNLTPDQLAVLERRGVDINQVFNQMRVQPGETTTGSYNYGGTQGLGSDLSPWGGGLGGAIQLQHRLVDRALGGGPVYTGSASISNPTGQTMTASYDPAKGYKSLEDVMSQYGVMSQLPTTQAEAMTDQQRQQLRALQQLATVSGGKFETKE